MASAWSLDFCLVCDCQTLGGAYCSQACRLSELDRNAAGSEPSSPTTSKPWSAVDSNNNHPSTTDLSNFNLNFKPSLPFEITPSPYKALSPSSSQTSLSSLASVSSSSSSSSLSDRSFQIESELRNYTGFFDQVRDWKRRLATS